jgi:glycosyltransferase involved in cell wall biosynthesis
MMCYDSLVSRPPARHPHVAIDVTPMLGARTGIGIAVNETIAALGALDDAPALIPYTLSVRARRMRADVPSETRFVPIPARILLRAWTRFDAPSIDRWIRPADVVHATNYLAPPTRNPLLVSVYDCSFVRYPELCTPEVRAFEPVLRRAVARGATLHTGSEFVAGEIEEIFGPGLRAAGRLVVIPLGVPPVADDAVGASADRPPRPAPYILAIGTIEPRKNYPRLIAAFGELAAKHPEIELVIAGRDGPDRAAVDGALATLDGSTRERVTLAGAISDDERVTLLRHATAVAYPSRYEGFGFPVLEAMRVGVPVVAARAGSIPEVAGDAALLVDPGDVSALATALARVVDDDALRADLIRRGSERVDAFSWAETARRLAACYRDLVAQPDRAR